MFTKTLALLLFPAFAVAQYGPAPTSSASPASSTSSAPAVAASVAPVAPPATAGQININVTSQGMLVFSPANITAPVGTLVTFYFPNSALTHSVTQSTFASPCTYLAADTSTNAPPGFDSGLTMASTYTLNVTDENPIWYFCKHPDHCGLGMVGSINAPTTGNTYSAYLAAAKAIGSSEVTTPDNGPVSGGVGATATGPPVSDLTSGASSTSTSGSSSPSPTSGAMKVTTSIGFTLFAAVLALVAMA